MDLKSLATQLELFHAIFDKSCDAVVIVDPKLTIRYWSDSSTELLGHAKSDVLNQNALDALVPKTSWDWVKSAFSEYQTTGKSKWLKQVHEIQVAKNSGDLMWIDLSVSEMTIAEQRWLMVIARDAESRKVRESELEQEASTDHLSGLANRSSFQNELEGKIGSPIVLAILDVDLFKDVNDTHGHMVGDEAICHMASAMNQFFEDAYCVARMGGDEFGMLLPGNQKAELENRFSDFLNELAESEFSDSSITITASVGVAIGSEESSARSLLTNADKALYESKHNGRNQVTVVSDSAVK